MKKLQLTFNQKYRTIHRIGFTLKSQIYKGVNLSSEQEIAVKLEAYNELATSSEIQKQAKIYRVIKGGVGMPNFYWFGVEHNYRALITDHLLKFCDGKFTLKTTLLIMDQLIDRIQWIHSKHLVYNDIDSSNFLVGLGKRADKIFVVDFCNCRKFVDQQSNHIYISKQTHPLKNNVRFRSIHSHIGKKTSRRDDLESLGYLVVYFLKGTLPWDSLEEDGDSEYREMNTKEKKASISVKNLCEGLPEEFEKYFNYIKTLEFEEEPDYVWIKRLFKDLFESKGFVKNNIMDWAEKHKY